MPGSRPTRSSGPTSFLIHPAAFQRGMQGALARFSIELEDQIGRTRGSSAADPDLGRARGLLNFPPDVWYFDLSKSLLPTVTSAQNYRAARQSLLAYNQRVAAKTAIFDVRTDSLGATLDRIGLDLGAQSALIDQHLRETGLWPINFDADRLFYQIKGRLYAYHMLLQELGKDFDPVIRPKNNVQNVWDQLMDTFNEAGEMRPSVRHRWPAPGHPVREPSRHPGLLPQAGGPAAQGDEPGAAELGRAGRCWRGSVGCWCAWWRWP